MYLLLVLELQPHLSALAHTRAGELGNNNAPSIHGKLCKNVHVWQTLSAPNIPTLKYLILRVFDHWEGLADLEISVIAFQPLVDTGAEGVREMQLGRNSVMS